MRSMLTLLLFLTLASPAFASDGVLEINQTCAGQTGCFSGDTPGFPVTITTPGMSYRLTSSLTVPNENTDGIVVSTSDVSVDLAGFSILGPVTCSGNPLVCTPATGSGSGVERVSLTNRGISVKNGSITGMGNYGVQLGDQAEVTKLRVRWSRVSGIHAGAGSTISDNTAHSNGSDGISADFGSTVWDNAAYSNGGDGIAVSPGSNVSGNTAFGNVGTGISTGTGSTVSGNSAYSNGGDGIFANSGSTVQRNTVRSNISFGLRLFQATYRENTITSNTAGTVIGTGINMGDNYCAGTGTISATCP